MTIEDVCGNTAADVLADKGAKMHQIPAGQAKSVKQLYARTHLVQARLGAVMKYLVDNLGKQAGHKEPAPSRREINIGQAILLTEHAPVVSDNGTHCVRCWTGCSANKRDLHAWLATPCVSIIDKRLFFIVYLARAKTASTIKARLAGIRSHLVQAGDSNQPPKYFKLPVNFG